MFVRIKSNDYIIDQTASVTDTPQWYWHQYISNLNKSFTLKTS